MFMKVIFFAAKSQICYNCSKLNIPWTHLCLYQFQSCLKVPSIHYKMTASCFLLGPYTIVKLWTLQHVKKGSMHQLRACVALSDCWSAKLVNWLLFLQVNLLSSSKKSVSGVVSTTVSSSSQSVLVSSVVASTLGCEDEQHSRSMAFSLPPVDHNALIISVTIIEA